MKHPPTDPQDLRGRIGRHVAELSDHPEMIRNSMRGNEKTLPEMPRTRWRILAIIGLILLPWMILVMLKCCHGGYWLQQDYFCCYVQIQSIVII